MAQPEPVERLKKKLGPFSVFAIATGTTLSAGFFLLPGLAFASAGRAVVLSYLIAGLLLVPAMLCLAVIVMRESRIPSYDPGYKSPFYPWLQIVGLIGPFVLIAEMGPLPILFSAGLIVVGALWFRYYGLQSNSRKGAIRHVFIRLGSSHDAGLARELRTILKEKRPARTRPVR